MNKDLAEKMGDTTVPGLEKYLNKSESSSMYCRTCDSEEVKEIIGDLESGKSSDIPIRIIKAGSKIIYPILSRFLNVFLDNCIFPKILKVGRIIYFVSVVTLDFR